jgi:hypothetical protein
MVDGVNRAPGANVPQTPIDGDSQTQGAGKTSGTDKVTAADQGVSAGDNLTVEQSADSGDTAGTGATHDIDEPAEGVDGTEQTQMESLGGDSWDDTFDVMAAVHQAIAETAKSSNENEQVANQMHSQDILHTAEAFDDQAKTTKEQATTDFAFNVAKAGTDLGTGIGGAATANSQSISAAVQTTGKSASEGLGAAQGLVDAGYQEDLTLAQKDQNLAQTSEGGDAKMRDKYDDAFNKSTSAEDTIRQQRGDMYNAQASAMTR